MPTPAITRAGVNAKGVTAPPKVWTVQMNSKNPIAITTGPADTILRPKRGTSTGPDMPAATLTPIENGIPVRPAFSTL